jgi:hypothetical protein
MIFYAHILPWEWTICPLVAAVKRRSLTPSTWSSSSTVSSTVTKTVCGNSQNASNSEHKICQWNTIHWTTLQPSFKKKNYSPRLYTQNYKYDCVGTATDVTQY